MGPPECGRPARVLHIGKFFPPFAGGMEHFLADLLPSQCARGTPAAALVHNEKSGLRGVRPEAMTPGGVYRAPCLGRLLYVPLSPAFPLWLARAIREWSPDLLHLHLPNSSALSALAVPAARRVPWVVHWHSDIVASDLDRRLAVAYRAYRPFEQRLLERAARIIATSPPYLEASSALRPWREKCRVVPLGLDPMRLKQPGGADLAKAEGHWGRSALRVLSIGRLTYYKGHEVLVRAAAGVDGVRVLIVGAGERRERLQRAIHAHAMQDRVELLGFLRDAEVAALLASCDVLCLPSLERTEAFGLVLLEAMHFGKPVLVSDIPGSGAPWVVGQAENGLLSPVGGAPGLEQALTILCRDPARRATLGQSGARALVRLFGIGAVADAIDAIYREALAQTG
ncbi:MAG: glycosyltransferase [Thiohalocapsa sp.]|nr:glycosyltransferase [Thiohalocapsa sp.]